MTEGNFEAALARSKSYTTQAIITLVLYLFLWIPGLVANVLYLMDANRSQKVAGQSLPGVGCLWFNLCVFAILPLVATCGFCVFGGGLTALGGVIAAAPTPATR